MDDFLTDEEMKRQKEIFRKYKNLYDRPCYSENLYMELNINNLRIFYQKALSELHDLQKLFRIKTYEDELRAMTPPLNSKI